MSKRKSPGEFSDFNDVLMAHEAGGLPPGDGHWLPGTELNNHWKQIEVLNSAEEKICYLESIKHNTSDADLSILVEWAGLRGHPEVHANILDRARRRRQARKRNGEDQEPKSANEQPRLPWAVPRFAWRDPATVPHRQFLYGKHYARGFVSVTIGDGGIGKSILKIVETLALATCRALLGVMPTERVRCLYWNGDEPYVEIERRIHAACQHYEIDGAQLVAGGWLFIGNSHDQPLMIGEMQNGRVVINPYAEADMRAMITQNNIGFAAFDPFKALHRVPENNATDIDAIIDLFSVVAERTHAAIGIDHHIRKPAVGQGEATSADARGSNALINKARLSRVLNPMTSATATQARVQEDQRGFYFRADSGKRNIAPPQQATWYKLVNVICANGDEVGVPVSWKIPGAFDTVTTDHMHRAREIARAGNYRKSSQEIGHPVAKMLDLDLDDEADRKQLKTILNTWFANGVLDIETRPDERTRHPRPFVVPGSWNEDDP